MPSVASDVPALSGAVPVPVAGAAARAPELAALELADDDDGDAVAPLDEDEAVLPPALVDPPPMDASAFCTAAVS